ncbi:MAG: nucleoside 2-deoxyribosyltransferase domain-containing protein, partial [archaeon]
MEKYKIGKKLKIFLNLGKKTFKKDFVELNDENHRDLIFKDILYVYENPGEKPVIELRKGITHFPTTFLGGTCNKSTWRKTAISKLKTGYFNPVVEEWDEQARIREETEKMISNFLLFVITPEIKGVYSIAEAVNYAIKDPKRTIFCVHGDFSHDMKRSLETTKKTISDNGAV